MFLISTNIFHKNNFVVFIITYNAENNKQQIEKIVLFLYVECIIADIEKRLFNFFKTKKWMSLCVKNLFISIYFLVTEYRLYEKLYSR